MSKPNVALLGTGLRVFPVTTNVLAGKVNAEPAALSDAPKGGFSTSIVLQRHSERMTTGNIVSKGISRLQLKDVTNYLQLKNCYNLD